PRLGRGGDTLLPGRGLASPAPLPDSEWEEAGIPCSLAGDWRPLPPYLILNSERREYPKLQPRSWKGSGERTAGTTQNEVDRL
ncbi:MAG: hypothetical protein J2P37_34785, partial [Ktedonobacteraceae bacterium]|nr:hypothetical protein [Ktedonobacteraceae bacterium]